MTFKMYIFLVMGTKCTEKTDMIEWISLTHSDMVAVYWEFVSFRDYTKVPYFKMNDMALLASKWLWKSSKWMSRSDENHANVFLWLYDG